MQNLIRSTQIEYNNNYRVSQLVETYYFLYYAHRQVGQHSIADQIALQMQYCSQQLGIQHINYFGKNQSVSTLLLNYFQLDENKMKA